MKSTIDIINETLSNNIFRMRLNDDEYPSEDICERCNGCGETIINNDTVFCFVNKEGDCCAQILDKENFAKEILELLDKIEICHKNEITEAYLAGTKTI